MKGNCMNEDTAMVKSHAENLRAGAGEAQGEQGCSTHSTLLKKLFPIMRPVLVACLLMLPIGGVIWIVNNTTFFLARLASDGEEWAYYKTRAEMMTKKHDGAVHWFRGWRAVPMDAVDIAYVGVTTSEGCGPWETRLTCRTSKMAFLGMANEYGYTVATNCFMNVLTDKDGGIQNDASVFVGMLPELFALKMPSEYLTFTCLTTNHTGMVMLLDCQSGKLYARLVNKWRFGDPNDWSWTKAVPKVEYLMRNEYEVR